MFVVAEFLLTSASRGPSAIAEPLVLEEKQALRTLAKEKLIAICWQTKAKPQCSQTREI